MSFQAALARKREAKAEPLTESDRRRNKRYNLSLLGRFMRADRHEYACRLIDISIGGVSLASPVAVDLDEQIIAYIDELGGLEGTVSRIFEGGFALSLKATRHKREKLAARITWLLNRSELGGLEDRIHERINPTETQTLLKLAEGISVRCQILDISLSGANLATEARPPIGAEVVLGKLNGKVMRHHDRGIGIRFLDIQEPEALKRHFG
ncbi:MAG: PilZ domain-containing protein [Hyphomicrobiaceae bacterium]|nr:PilZ domain-containing protein [Hyphomicrobiaceae bacterium]